MPKSPPKESERSGTSVCGMQPLRLNPSDPAQLGERALVLWDRPSETPRRGILARLSFCSNPECQCATVRMKVAEIDERLVTVEYDDQSSALRLGWSVEESETPPVRFDSAGVDMYFGALDTADDEAERSALADRLGQALHAELVDELVPKHHRAKKHPPRRARRQPVDYTPPDRLFRDEVYSGARMHLLRVGGATIQASDLYCPAPDCDCRLVRVLFERLEDGSQRTRLGIVPVSTSEHQDDVAWTFEPEPGADSSMLEHAWAEYESGFRDVVGTLRAREEELRKQLRPLMAMTAGGLGDDPFVRDDAKVGRNQPCPCGSGRKHKRCCGKAGASA